MYILHCMYVVKDALHMSVFQVPVSLHDQGSQNMLFTSSVRVQQGAPRLSYFL